MTDTLVGRLRPEHPRRIGAYEVTGFLGEGGMGLVFAGRGPGGTQVAIKVVRAELAADPLFRARFRREADSARRVPRFCTAEVLDAGPDADPPYLVTEFIDGPTLEDAVRADGPLRGGDLDLLAVSVATALAGIHAAGIMHRDLKPANVLLSRLGPRVIDFGIAGAVDATRLTVEGRSVGTPAYMAPEQLQAQRSPASDVFSWGGVMVYAATGRRPFGGGSLPLLAVNIMQGEPDLTGLTGRLRDVVAAAMRKDPADRPAAAQLLEMLGATSGHAEISRRQAAQAEDADLDRTRTSPAWAFSRYVHAPAGADSGPPAQEHTAPTLDAGSQSEQASLPQGWQTTWTPPSRGRHRSAWRRRRIRSLATILGCVAIIAAAAGWLLMRDQTAPLRLTGVEVRVERADVGCDTNVDVAGVLTTNGSPGEIIYQWHRSDQRKPDPVRRQNIEKGRTEITVHMFWDVTGPGTRDFTATLRVLEPGPAQNSATFTYSCKSG